MGSVAEVYIKTAARWSVTGEVVAIVHKLENLLVASTASEPVLVDGVRPSGRDSAAVRHRPVDAAVSIAAETLFAPASVASVCGEEKCCGGDGGDCGASGIAVGAAASAVRSDGRSERDSATSISSLRPPSAKRQGGGSTSTSNAGSREKLGKVTIRTPAEQTADLKFDKLASAYNSQIASSTAAGAGRTLALPPSLDSFHERVRRSQTWPNPIAEEGSDDDGEDDLGDEERKRAMFRRQKTMQPMREKMRMHWTPTTGALVLGDKGKVRPMQPSAPPPSVSSALGRARALPGKVRGQSALCSALCLSLGYMYVSLGYMSPHMVPIHRSCLGPSST